MSKKIKEGDIIICETDKSGKLCAVTRSAYLEMGLKHTVGDVEILNDEINKIQAKLRGHTSMWCKMAGVGSNWNHDKRIKDSLMERT